MRSKKPVNVSSSQGKHPDCLASCELFVLILEVGGWRLEIGDWRLEILVDRQNVSRRKERSS